MSEISFGLEHLNINGEPITAITRDDGRFESLQLVSALMDLSRDDEAAYLMICNMIFMLRDRALPVDGLEA